MLRKRVENIPGDTVEVETENEKKTNVRENKNMQQQTWYKHVRYQNMS